MKRKNELNKIRNSLFFEEYKLAYWKKKLNRN